MRQFFWAPKTYDKTDGKQNIYNFTLEHFVFLNLWVGKLDLFTIIFLFKGAYQKYNSLISQPKHMLRVLKRTVSMRRFFWAPKTYDKTDG